MYKNWLKKKDTLHLDDKIMDFLNLSAMTNDEN
jgi:hypothetical protein